MTEKKEQKRPSNERPEIGGMSEVRKALNALSQIANVYNHGMEDVDGKALDRGLRSDSDDMPTGYMGKQQIDGFNISIFADMLVLKYHTDVTAREIHSAGKGKYEEKVKDTMNDVLNYIKGEFKDITGKTLNLTQVGDYSITLDYMNAHRSWVIATVKYRVGNLSQFSGKEMDGDSYEKLYGVRDNTANSLNESEEGFDLRSWLIDRKEDRIRNILDD